jgi:hypothetical protein
MDLYFMFALFNVGSYSIPVLLILFEFNPGSLAKRETQLFNPIDKKKFSKRESRMNYFNNKIKKYDCTIFYKFYSICQKIYKTEAFAK